MKLYYLNKNYHQLAKQGSDAWLSGRQTRFGGSEIANITGKKSDKQILIVNKIKQLFKTNLFCWWGQTFESIAKYYMYKVLMIDIHEFGAIPATNYPVAYSPDGVIIKNNDLCLLEIKCPFLRDVNITTNIKDCYMKQIQMGMVILPCDTCEFIQFKFRKCKDTQIHTIGAYDRYFHKETRRSPKQNELWYGALYWNTRDAITYNYITERPPDKIYYSFQENVYNICEKYNKGVLMYFKCFYINTKTIKKDISFENNKNKIWTAYYELINQFNRL